MKKTKYCRTIIEVYKGKRLYQYNDVHIRVSTEVAKNIIDGVEETGLSVAQLLGHSSKPCECCRNTNVITFNSQNEKVSVIRGLLFKSTQSKYGVYNNKKQINEQSNGVGENDNEING